MQKRAHLEQRAQATPSTLVKQTNKADLNKKCRLTKLALSSVRRPHQKGVTVSRRTARSRFVASSAIEIDRKNRDMFRAG